MGVWGVKAALKGNASFVEFWKGKERARTLAWKDLSVGAVCVKELATCRVLEKKGKGSEKTCEQARLADRE